MTPAEHSTDDAQWEAMLQKAREQRDNALMHVDRLYILAALAGLAVGLLANWAL